MTPTEAQDLFPDLEHVTLRDASGPHCRCGWIPRTDGPRAQTAVNTHVTRENRKVTK